MCGERGPRLTLTPLHGFIPTCAGKGLPPAAKTSPATSLKRSSARTATFAVSSAMLRCLRGLEREESLALDIRRRLGADGRVGMAVAGPVPGLRAPRPCALPHPCISPEPSLRRAPRGRRPSRLRTRPGGMGLSARVAWVPPGSLILTDFLTCAAPGAPSRRGLRRAGKPAPHGPAAPGTVHPRVCGERGPTCRPMALS